MEVEEPKMVAGSGHYQSVGHGEKRDLLQFCWLLESYLSIGTELVSIPGVPQ